MTGYVRYSNIDFEKTYIMECKKCGKRFTYQEEDILYMHLPLREFVDCPWCSCRLSNIDRKKVLKNGQN